MSECVQTAELEALETKSPRPGLTSRFVGVFGRHEVGVHLHGLGREARWVECPRLASESHT